MPNRLRPQEFAFCWWGSVSGDKAEPAIYAANIENCGDCWVTAYLDPTSRFSR
jgi:hypothetical protein